MIGPVASRMPTPPRFGVSAADFTRALCGGDPGEDLYNRLMIGNGRTEITHAGRELLRGYLEENPDKILPLLKRLHEERIPPAIINAILPAPKTPQTMLNHPKTQDALKALREDTELDALIRRGQVPTRSQVRQAWKRLLRTAHSDTGASDNADKLERLMKAWETLSEFLPKN